MSYEKVQPDATAVTNAFGRNQHVPAAAERSCDEITVFGMRFSTLDTEQALKAIVGRDPRAPFSYVVTPNAVHVVHYERKDPLFVAGVDGAWLRLNDSRVVKRLAKMVMGVSLKLAPGSDLTALMLNGAIEPDDAVTLIGGTAEMERRLRERFGLRSLQRHEPPHHFIADPAMVERCVDFVVDHPARYVFLACGAPQSEVLGRRIVDRGGAVGTGLCIGASLLFVTGLDQRAPVFVQRAGLEWLHRLVREPRRMGRRLLNSQLPLLPLVYRQWRR